MRAAIADRNTKIFKTVTGEESDKEFIEGNEIICITIAYKFQPLDELNDFSTGVQKTAEIKRLTNIETNQEKTMDELFEERRKAHELENAMQDKENASYI